MRNLEAVLTDTLERVVYCSHATTANADTVGSLVQILAVSQRNNARDDITGALAVADDRYFQVIEGKRSAIDRLLKRIATDPRHHRVAIAERRPIQARRFGQWAMVAPTLTPQLAVQIGKAVDECHDNPARAVDLLEEIVARQHEAGRLTGG